MGKNIISAVSVIVLLAVAITANAGELRVGAGETYSTIQSGIDAVVDGGVVIVGDGVYTGDGNRDIDFKGKAITVRSENGADNCIIDCEADMDNRHRGFLFHSGETLSSVVEGFTIRNGNHLYGGGINCSQSSATVIGCKIMDNRGSRGAGIYCYRGNLDLINCLIVNNSTMDLGGAIYCQGKMRVINCTTAGNRAGIPGNVVVKGTAEFYNSIIWENHAPIAVLEESRVTVSNSNIQGGFDGEGNIDVDPEFEGVNDYRLGLGSPCIDVGAIINIPNIPATDIEGASRIMDGDCNLTEVIDMGAYEYSYISDVPILGVLPERLDFGIQAGGYTPESKKLSIWNCGVGELHWEILEDCAWLEVSPSSGSSLGEIDEVAVSVNLDGLETGMYRCVLEVADTTEGGDVISLEVTLHIGSISFLVPQEYSNIQAAIDASIDGDEVIVDDGVYKGDGNRDINFKGKAITVRSENGAENCIIDCEGSEEEYHRGFVFINGEGADSVVDGFTIRGGKAVLGAGIYCTGTAPTIKGCIIRDNDSYVPTTTYHSSTGKGGGIYGSRGKIINCQILDNISDNGGGLYDCDGFIENCVISGNRALDQTLTDPEDPGGYPIGKGGGLYGCDAEIVNCWISENEAYPQGGGLYNCSVIMRKCVVTGNIALEDLYEMTSYGGGFESCSGTINDTVIMNNEAGDGGAFRWGTAALNNCLIIGNKTFRKGAAMSNFGGSINNCTITNNICQADSKASVFYRSNVPVRNSIVWGNSDPLFYGSSPSITFSNVQGDWEGQGNIDEDPLFVSGPDGNYYLSQIASEQGVDSLCVDAGNGLAVDVGLDGGSTRTDGVGDVGVVDMGYHYPVAVPSVADLNGDGFVDILDFGEFALGWSVKDLKRIPVGSVVVDGEFSEWGDQDVTMLDESYYGHAADVDSAQFVLRWDPETDKIYAVVLVFDENQWFTDGYEAWDASDRVEVYCQGDAAGGTGWDTYYDGAQQYMVGPNTLGGAWATWGWGQEIGDDAGFEYVVWAGGDTILYEVGVRAFEHYGGMSMEETVSSELQAGDVVGFDIVVDTRWAEDGFGMLSENMMTGKSLDAGKFARYVLVDAEGGEGRIDVADLNRDGFVGVGDLLLLAEEWLKEGID